MLGTLRRTAGAGNQMGDTCAAHRHTALHRLAERRRHCWVQAVYFGRRMVRSRLEVLLGGAHPRETNCIDIAYEPAHSGPPHSAVSLQSRRSGAPCVSRCRGRCVLVEPAGCGGWRHRRCGGFHVLLAALTRTRRFLDIEPRINAAGGTYSGPMQLRGTRCVRREDSGTRSSYPVSCGSTCARMAAWSKGEVGGEGVEREPAGGGCVVAGRPAERRVAAAPRRRRRWCGRAGRGRGGQTSPVVQAWGA